MNARGLMSGDVVTVSPNTPLRDVARTLLAHKISAVPVVDDGGSVVGMVSEGDLVGRKKTERETQSEWWLQRLAEGEPLNSEFLAHLQSPLAKIPHGLSGQPLELVADGNELVYTFDAQREHTGIAGLLRSLNEQGIDFKDLHSSESSLEEIFVSLVRTKP